MIAECVLRTEKVIVVQHDECRTQRLILEGWDRMESDRTFRSMGL